MVASAKRRADRQALQSGGAPGKQSKKKKRGAPTAAARNASSEDEGEEEGPKSTAEAYDALLSSLKQTDSHDPENSLVTELSGRAPENSSGSKLRSAGQLPGTGERKSGGEANEEEDDDEDEDDEEGVEGEGVAVDFFAGHFEKTLQAAKASSPTGGKWADAAVSGAPEWLRKAFPRSGKWQALGALDGLPGRAPRRLAALGVRERLSTLWQEAHESGASEEAMEGGGGGGGRGKHGKEEEHPQMWKGEPRALMPGGDFADKRQAALFSFLATYRDVFLPDRPYPARPDAPDPVMDALLLHSLNHCARSADLIKKNNDMLKARKTEAIEKGVTMDPDSVPSDQGFARPKVLLLLPQRNLAFRVISRLLQLAIRETRKDTIQGKERFLMDFSDMGIEEEEDTGRRKVEKPGEYKALFSGNMDDHFMVGIRLNRGSVQLYADFLQCDIIVASPIAVVTRLEEDAGGKAGDRPQAKDFLSSIEILVADRADFMLMQNWGHVITALSSVNQLPTEQNGIDIMRVREGVLSGEAQIYRQTVVLSSFASPELNALVHRHCCSHSGGLRWKPEPRGVLTSVAVQVQQIFERLPQKPAAEAHDARFEHFKRNVWPGLKESNATGQLIFVASYFDFVRLRNFLLKETSKQDFVSLCEYTKRSDVSRGRSNFFHGRRKFMLYTERSHFYNRHFLRGVRDVLFYSLPTHSAFYYEIVNFLEAKQGDGAGASHGTVSVMYDRYDALTLERTVGAKRAAKMLKGSSSTFMFC